MTTNNPAVVTHDQVLVVNLAIAKTIASTAMAYAPNPDDLKLTQRADPVHSNMFIIDIEYNMQMICIVIGEFATSSDHTISVSYMNNLKIPELNFKNATIESIANTFHYLFNK